MEPGVNFLPNLNAENKLLQARVQKQEDENASLTVEIQRTSDRVQALSEHMKNVRQELQHAMSLSGIRKRELETEEHMRMLAEREEDRLKQQMRQIDKQLTTVKTQLSDWETQVHKNQLKVEDMKANMDIEKDRLQKWIAEAKKRDEDAMVLQKYATADEAHVKAQQLQLEKAEEEFQQCRRDLETEVTETITTQVELDKIAEQFRRLHLERQELVEQYEATIIQMQRRDRQIDQTALAVADERADVMTKRELMKERQRFLEQEVGNCKDEENQIMRAEKTLARTRLDLQQAELSRQQLTDELETLKFMVDRTASDSDRARALYQRLKDELQVKSEKLALIQAHVTANQNSLKEKTIDMLNAEDAAQAMEVRVATETDTVSKLEKALEKCRDFEFKTAQDLFELKRKREDMSAELQGARFAYRNLGSKLRKVDDETLKQEELIYGQDFALQQLEHKLGRMQGDRTNEEKVQLNAKIKALTEQWETQKQTQSMLTTQLKKAGDDVRRVTKRRERCAAEMDDLKGKIEEIHLHNDNAQRELKKVTTNKQDALVENNLLKVQVKRLRESLNYRAGQLMTLETSRQELETVIAQRRHDIQLHEDMLKAQLKTAENERQTISLELQERLSRVEKLRKRYEIVTLSMAPPEGEEEHTQVHYIIKAAQEKEELQRHGDELDLKTQKAEREIIAMDNTLRLINGSNSAFRTSLNPVTSSSEEREELEKLQRKLHAATDKFKFKHKEVERLQGSVRQLKDRLNSLNTEEVGLIERFGQEQNAAAYAKKDAEDQKAKTDRAQRQLAKAHRDLHSSRREDAEQVQNDIEARELRDFNMSSLQQVGKIARDYPATADTVLMLCQKLDLPPPPTSGVSSRAGSASGSLVSLSSRSSAASRRSSAEPSISDDNASSSAFPSTRRQRQASSLRSTPHGSRTASRSSSLASSRASSRRSTPRLDGAGVGDLGLVGTRASVSQTSVQSSRASSRRV